MCRLNRTAMSGSIFVWVIFTALILAGCARSPREKAAQYLQRGQSMMERKDHTRAILEFKNAAREMPKDAEPQYQLGIAYLATANLPGALNSLRKATELDPRHSAAQLKLAALMMTSRNKDLIADAEKRLREV